MVQPPLDHHYVVMHLGGAKQVNRRRDGPAVSTLAEDGSLTFVPAGSAYVWRTEGPIAFAHLYLRPDQLLQDDVSASCRGDARGATLVERVGCRDPLLEMTFARMLGEIRSSARPSHLLLDALLESFRIRLAGNHTSCLATRSRAVALAPHRLRRVLELIDANLGRDIGLAHLVAAAGTSQFHFSRAFRLATGRSPYRYLLQRRIEQARVLLLVGHDSLDAISQACGFNSRHQFSVMFKRVVGVTPKRFRMTHDSPPGKRDAGRSTQTCGGCEASQSSS